MNLAPLRVPPRDTSVMMLLVAVNILLLSFFVMLTSMSVPGQSHAKHVLQDVQNGYPIKTPTQHDTTGQAPQVPMGMWAEEQAKTIVGIVVNRLNLQTPPLVSSANQVVLILPGNALFQGTTLVQKETIEALKIASQAAAVSWVIRGPAGAQLAGQAAALAQHTGQLVMQPGATTEVLMIVRPLATTAPTVGTAVQTLGRSVNGEATGQTRP
jgi:hypothetical protein